MKMRNDSNKTMGFLARYLLLGALFFSVWGAAPKVSAQEILLEGPLAGQAAVRKMVQYRNLRFSVGPQFGYTLLNEYMHNFMPGLKLEFNVTDWLGVGVVGFYAFNTPTSLTKHIGKSRDIGGSPTVPSDSNWPSYTGAANFKNQVSRLQSMVMAQLALVPFRGKMSIFEKAFVGIDGYLFVGGGVVIFQQRKDCTAVEDEVRAGEYPCGDLGLMQGGARLNDKKTRVKGAPTFGLGFTAYFNDWIGLNLEYRLTPFKWNAGGSDESGQAGAQWVLASDANGDLFWTTEAGGKGNYPDKRIDKEDQTWNANQSIILGVVFNFPTKPRISD